MSHRLIALILGTVLLSGCAGFTLRGDSSAKPTPAGLAALPFPKDRAVSGVTEYTHTGVETATRSPGASELGARLELDAAAGGIEWATYMFTPSGNYPLGVGTVTLGVPGSFGAWVAVANFATLHWDFSGPFTGVADVPLAAGDLSPLGHVYMAVIVSDGGVAKVDEVKMSETSPDLPVASLTSPAPKVNPLETVSLDASGSTTTNGAITDYQWDLDGNGVFNEAGAEQSFQGSATATLTFGATPTAVDVAVQVTDTLGLQDTATLTVTAVGWIIVNVNAAGAAGNVVSLAAINGKPAIAYSTLPGALTYAYSSTADGSSGWTSLDVDSTNTVGYCSLAQVNGHPAVAYQQNLPHDLLYAYSSAPDGASGWTTLPLNEAAEVQASCSLRVIGGKPAVATYTGIGGSNDELEYYYAHGPDGDTGWDMTIVDSGDTCGFACNMANLSEQPAIVYCYYMLGVYYTEYAINANADGSGSWTYEQVASDVALPDNLNLVQLANGNPVMSYKGFNGSLWFAHSTAPVGGSWSKLSLLGGNTGGENSMTLIAGKPQICTRNSDASLYFGRPATSDGSGSWTFNAVETETVNATNTSLADIHGRPGIAYRPSGGGLYYATLYD